MKSAGILKGLTLCLVALGVCLAGAVHAASPTSGPVVQDIALVDGGLFVGQLVDAQGVAKPGEQVDLLFGQRRIAAVRTDVNGRFAFRELRGGVYQTAAAGQVNAYRLWAPGTAPKGTPARAMLVAAEDLVRAQSYQQGQYYYYQQDCNSHLGRAKYWLANPWVVSGIVATAVAVPVGIHNADSSGTPSSP